MLLVTTLINAQDVHIFRNEDHQKRNQLVEVQDDRTEGSISPKNPEIIPLSAPNTELIKLDDGQYYLKKTDIRTGQSIMINLNEVYLINFRDKEIQVKQEKPSLDLQVFPPFEWTPVLAYEQFPKQRGGHSTHAVGDNLVIWGGCYIDITCFNDLYMYNIRTKLWSYPKSFGDPPSPRSGHSSFINGAKIYIFGGNSQSGLLSDLHEFDLESRSWNQLFWQGQKPGPRANHQMVLTNKGIAVLFGGYIGDGFTNEVYFLDLIQELWSKPIIDGRYPLPRESFSMTYNRNNIWVFGGYATGVLLNDFFVLNMDSLSWSEVNTFGTIPNPRQGHLVVKYDQRHYVLGGCNPKIKECFSDLHTFDTSTLKWDLIGTFGDQIIKPVEYQGGQLMGNILMIFGGCHLMNNCSNDLIAIRVADSETCPHSCSQNGICRNGRCQCHAGYQENDCSVRVYCKQNCLAQGFCISSGRCQCYPGFSGQICQIYVPCPNNCTNPEQGICRSNGICECQKKFYGDSCEKQQGMLEFSVKCPNKCSEQGECNYQTGLCICNEGFGGPDCSHIEVEQMDEDDSLLIHIQNENLNAYEDNENQEQNEGDGDDQGGGDEQGLLDGETSEYQTLIFKDGVNLSNNYNTLQPINISGQNLMMKNEPEAQIMDRSNCPGRCSRKGICVQYICLCPLGYTGEQCQASKIKDLVIGYRKSNVYFFAFLSFLLGIVAGLLLIRLYEIQGTQNEFRNIDDILEDEQIGEDLLQEDDDQEFNQLRQEVQQL